MKVKIRRKKSITLIEIIIVMFFITIITGVVAYNIKGALDEGKAFRTLETMKRLENMIEMEVASGSSSLEDFESDLERQLQGNPLVPNPRKLIIDAWGEPFKVEVVNDKLVIESRRFSEYLQKNPGSMFKDDRDDQN